MEQSGRPRETHLIHYVNNVNALTYQARLSDWAFMDVSLDWQRGIILERDPPQVPRAPSSLATLGARLKETYGAELINFKSLRDGQVVKLSFGEKKPALGEVEDASY